MKKMILLPLLLLPVLEGCSTTNITKLTQALAKDNATVDVEIKSIYGTITFHRSMPVPVTNAVTNVKLVP